MLAFSLRFNTREKDGLEILVQRLESRLWGVGGVSDSIPEQVRKEPSQTDLDTFSHLIAVPIRLRSETIQPCPSLHLGRLVARTPERRRRRIGLCVTATCTL